MNACDTYVNRSNVREKDLLYTQFPKSKKMLSKYRDRTRDNTHDHN